MNIPWQYRVLHAIPSALKQWGWIILTSKLHLKFDIGVHCCVKGEKETNIFKKCCSGVVLYTSVSNSDGEPVEDEVLFLH